MLNTNETKWWSAKDVVDKYETLGIPHFQRGLVWTKDTISLLIESLYLGSPCGTFLLWKAEDCERQGVPLIKGRHPEYLIVDGQQRIRSLYQVFVGSADDPEVGKGPDDHEEEEEEEEGEGEGGDDGGRHESGRQTTWCINLWRLDEFKGMLAGRPPSPLPPLFAWLLNPENPKARFRYNMVPLFLLRERETDRIQSLLRATGDPRQVLDALFAPRGVNDRLCEMRTKPRFLVIFLSDTQKAQGVEKKEEEEDVAGLYVRINSGGKRVSPEEKAFASLVKLRRETTQWIQELFAKLHPPQERRSTDDRSDDRAELARDEALQRQKERSFGLKLFVRTLVQVFAYHLDRSLGSASFSFHLVDSLRFRRLLSDPNCREKVDGLFKRTGEVLDYVRNILADHLFCDDLRMLPDTRSLEPMFHLLIRFPSLMQNADSRVRPTLASLALRLLLARSTQDHRLGLVKVVDGSEDAAQAVHVLFAKSTDEQVQSAVKKGIQKALSLQNRYVLMLYWLLRKRGAKDFSYQKNFDDREGAPSGPERAVGAGEKPVRQHIVPYARLMKEVDGETKRGRITRHPVNGIGNLTWISHHLNYALGDNFTNLEDEHSDNRERHFLDGKVPAAYQEVRNVLENGHGNAMDRFEQFAELRSEQIAQAFVDWIAEVDAAGEGWSRIDPEKRWFAPSLDDRVQEMDYPNAVVDALLKCLRAGPLVEKKPPKRERDNTLVLCGPKPNWRKLRLALRPTVIAVKQFEPLREVFDRASVVDRCPGCGQKHSEEWVLPVCEEHAERTAAVLHEIAARLGESPAAVPGPPHPP